MIEGDEFFGAYQNFESFEGNHPRAFTRLLDEVKKARVPLFFVSGDRHLAQLQKLEPALIGYTAYELTTSAIHAKVFPGTLAKFPVVV